MAFTVMSPAFAAGDRIPSLYTCDGANMSPPLKWMAAPSETQAFALIMDDPDAPGGTWDHWIVFNIPPQNTAWLEGDTTLPGAAKEGRNSWNKTGYGGPCPPDREHRYIFRLYALDDMLDLSAGVSKEELLEAMEPHILAVAELIGRYERRQG